MEQGKSYKNMNIIFQTKNNMKPKYILIFFLFCLFAKSQGQNIVTHSLNPGNIMTDPIDLGIIEDATFDFADVRNTNHYHDYYTNDHTGNSTNDVFYKFTLIRPMDITISHCGSELSSGDTFVFLLKETTSWGIQEWDYNDDGSLTTDYAPAEWKCQDQPSLAYLKCLDLEPGTYYVVSEGYSQNGMITTRIQGASRKEYDLGEKKYSFSYTHTQNTENTPNAHQGRPTNDVFYKFTLARKMDVIISHCGSSLADTYLYVLKGRMHVLYEDDNSLKRNECSSVVYSNKQAYLKIEDLPAGSYYVVSEGASGNGSITTTIEGHVVSKEFHNYIRTRTMTNDDGSEYLDEIKYFDGLGRPNVGIQIGASPKRYNVVNYQEYDNKGRSSNTWLPRVESRSNDKFVAFNEFKKLSTNLYQNDTRTFSEPIYESSPLNLVNEQYGPGQDWYNNSKQIEISYHTNSTALEFRCHRYSAEGRGINVSLKRNSVYANNQLFVTKTKDEDGNLSYEFKNKLNQVILTRQKNGTDYYDTYYVHDDFGNLCYVLPPMCSLTTGTTYTDTHDLLNKYAYLYKYDNRNRCIKKRLPGCDWIYYVYDKADRLIFSQDGEQRLENKWHFTKYDAFGREILSGVQTINKSHDQLINEYKNVVVKESMMFVSGYSYRYTWNTMPDVNYQGVLVVNHYDDYEHFLIQPGYESLRYQEKNGYGKCYNNNSYAAKGLLTAKREQILGGDGSVTEVVDAYFYDERGRLIQTRGRDHIGATNDEYIAYNFTGKPTEKMMYHGASYLEYTISERYKYTYDHAGRLKTVKHMLNNQGFDRPEITLASYNYDELGRMNYSCPIGSTEFEQFYTYNVRSWLTGTSGDLFSQKIYYNQSPMSGIPKYYNGNISATLQTPSYEGDGTFWLGYGYHYDNLSRLTQAISLFEDNGYGVGASGYYDTYYSYDKSGNINYLSRKNDLSYIDDLSFTYNGNRLIKTTEIDYDGMLTTGSYDFKDYSQGLGEYLYNRNGAMIADFYRGAEITYNPIGMPQRVSVPNILGTIDYTYSATGQRLSAKYKWHSSLSLDPIRNTGTPPTQPNKTLTRDYVKNYVYENGLVKRILTENGYFESGKYYFYYKDHLGNNAVIADQNANIVQYQYYYPFGMPENDIESWGNHPYRFGGKEFDTMHGLNLYDFHARQYDPALGRFMSIDPLAEKYYSISPYSYCMNNPVKFIDTDGKQVRPARPNVRPTPGRYVNNVRYRHVYPNGIRPQSTTKTLSINYQRKLSINIESPIYINDFVTPYGNKVSITNNNKRGQALALFGDAVQIRVENIEKRLYAEDGPKIERTTEIKFDDFKTQAVFSKAQNEYDKLLDEKIEELLEKEDMNFMEALNKAIKELGPSPTNQVKDWLKQNQNNINTESQTIEKDIPEIRQGDNN